MPFFQVQIQFRIQPEWSPLQRGLKNPSSWVQLDFECTTSAAYTFKIIKKKKYKKPLPAVLGLMLFSLFFATILGLKGSAQWMLSNDSVKSQFFWSVDWID